MFNRTLQRALLFSLIAMIVLSACDGGGTTPAGNALILRWEYSTSISDWAQQSAADFNRQGIKASNGQPIWIDAVASDAGQAVSDMLGGGELPALWTAADASWREVLHQESNGEVFLPNCVSIAESPLVIAMWEPIAQALGWPGRTLGWLDVASLAADPTGWAYYSGGAWGSTLRLGHTHPGLSDSGVQTLQALVYAAQASPDLIDVTDVENPVVQASVGAFESAVSWFAKDSAQLGTTMLERGIGYLNAAVTYENAVIMQGERSPRLVAIYPFEGTFMATYPTCVRNNMDEAATGAAETFLAYLLDTQAQQNALALGLRPVSDDVPLGPPFDAAHGVDPSQPELVFATAGEDTVFAIQDLWQQQRKNVNLALVLDVSGSMEGAKIEQVRLSAVEFVKQMGDNDYLSVIIFDDFPRELVAHAQVQGNRQEMIDRVNIISAGGGTALYDTIVYTGKQLAGTRRADTVNAMVVLTDGQDTTSQTYRSPDATFGSAVLQTNASIYTIAYGDDADRDIMRQIALATSGIAYEGDVSNIGEIYGEISAAFGGSLGIGR